MLQAIESLLIKIRDIVWEYPEAFIFGKNSLYQFFNRYYQVLIPFSHFVAVFLILTLSITLISVNSRAWVAPTTDTLIEGVIVGTDETGQLQRISRISPLISTSVQLERDLSELIYQSLIRVDQKGTPAAEMADYLEIKKGEHYSFRLKENLYWQDGRKVNSTDVQKTFELLQKLDERSETRTQFSRAAAKLNFVKVDERSFELKTKIDGAIIPEPGFFEAISFKILPAQYVAELTPDNITLTDPYINRFPLGSGPYKLISATDEQVVLEVNELYPEQPKSIKRIIFQMFPDEQSATEAIKSGKVHAVADLSTDSVRGLENLQYLNAQKSNVVYNQYWGVYFNLAEQGNPALKDAKVRQGISAAVDKDKIVNVLIGFSEKATGPIPKTSFAYQNYDPFAYNKQRSRELLEQAGWKLQTGEKFRNKEGKVLTFELVYVNNPDRAKIAEIIQKDLAEVGVDLKLTTKNRETVVNENIRPRQFDLLLWGVQTFIDPDRFELFHSSQSDDPGLNLASYSSSEKKSIVSEGKLTKIPLSDDDLDEGRKSAIASSRRKKYVEFQKTLASDAPIIFLFHPIEAYVVNKRVKGVKIDNLRSLEERFDTVADWTIELT